MDWYIQAGIGPGGWFVKVHDDRIKDHAWFFGRIGLSRL